MREFSRSFRAMNTEVVAVVAAEAEREAGEALAEVEALFRQTEEALSRFLPESELSRLNRSAGRSFPASPLLLQAVAEALAAARDTEGLFDPTVLGSLIEAGYDRSFELLPQDPLSPDSLSPGERELARWRDVVVDEKAAAITLPPGVGLDLGGIGKGWTVDRAADLLRPFGNFAVDAGGDLCVSGSQAGGDPWTIGAQDPFDPERDLLVLALPPSGRAVATSTTRRRRWQHAGREQHHLIDPRTGHPARSGVVSATVVAATVARAEVLAKVALLMGPREGFRYLQRREGTEGLLVLEDGRVELTKGLLEVQRAA